MDAFRADSEAVAKLQIAMEMAAKREDYAAAAELQQQLRQLRAAQAEAEAQMQPQQKQQAQHQDQEHPGQDDEPHPAAAALETFRERQRMRAAGAPVGVWSVSTDPNLQDDEATRTSEARVDGSREMRRQQQREAADAVFESKLTSEVPDGFCEGLDAYLDDRDDRVRGDRQTITEPGEQP